MEVYMLIAILYIPFVFSAYDDSGRNKYTKIGVGSLCSGNWESISRAGDCVRAARALDLQFEAMWDGPGDFPGCLLANDGRDRVYYNISPRPGGVPNNSNYTAICQKKYGSPYRKFGFETSYFENANLDTSPVAVQGCEPAYLLFVARYGASYPEERHVESLKTQSPILRDKIVAAADNGRLEEKTLKLFKSWNFGIWNFNHLAAAGEREHEELGWRWRRRLGGLLNETDRVLVRALDYPTNRDSAHYFLKGVFQTNVTVPPSPQPEDDFILNFMNNCPKWKQGVDHNNVSLVEMKKLESSQDYMLMVKEVGERVGLKLTPPQVEVAWNMCRREAALFPLETSPWCQIFSNVNLRLLDFREDLRYYYKHGYGNPVNLKATQPIFEDIFQKFEEIEEGKREYKAALYFGHALTIAPVLAALGLYHDEQHLKASDWPDSQDHQWRMSYLASFAANLGLVLLECEGEKEHKWKVMVFHQERPVKLPACGQEVCTLQQFKQSYEHWTTLDFQAFCKFELK